MYYRVCKMEVHKQDLPTFCDITKENHEIFLRLMDLYMGGPDYEVVMEWGDDDENYNGIEINNKYDEIVETFCLACINRKSPKNGWLSAVWVEWADDKEESFSILESYVDDGNGKIFYDYADFDTSHIGVLNGDPMVIYDRERDLTSVLLMDESERDCQYSGILKRVFSYTGFPNECITDAYIESLRNTETDTDSEAFGIIGDSDPWDDFERDYLND